jgi:hypothetical protein
MSFRLRIAILFVLIDSIVDALSIIGLDFDGGDRDTVEEQNQVDAILVEKRVTHLANDSQPIGSVSLHDIGVHRESRFELGHTKRLLHPQHVKPVTDHVQCSSACSLAHHLRGFCDSFARHKSLCGSRNAKYEPQIHLCIAYEPQISEHLSPLGLIDQLNKRQHSRSASAGFSNHLQNACIF